MSNEDPPQSASPESDSEDRCVPRNVLAAIGEGSFEVDREGGLTAVSDRLVDRTEFEQSGLVGEDLTALFAEPVAERIRSAVEEVCDGTARVRTVDFERLAGRDHGRPQSVKLGSIDEETAAGVVTTARDERRTQNERRLVWGILDAVEGIDSLEDTLEAVLERVCEDSNWERGEAWIPRDDGTLERRATATFDPEVREAVESTETATELDEREGLVGRVYASGESELITNLAEVDEDTIHHQAAAVAAGVRSTVAVPVTYDGDVESVLTFYRTEQLRPEDPAVDTVRSVGRQLGEPITRRLTEERLRGREEQIRLLVESVEEYAIFMLDTDGTVMTWNEGAERIKGYEESDIVGEHFSTFYTQTDRDEGVPETNLETAREEGDLVDEGWRVREDGSRIWANVVITAIRDEDGDVEGFAKITRDMTDRRVREQELRHERDVTTQVLETSPVGIAVLDADNQPMRFNERVADILEVEERDLVEFLTDGLQIYDEDGDPIPPSEWPNTRVLETGDPVNNWVCQVETAQGNRRWLSTNARTIPDEDGEIDRVVLTATDVTEQRERQRELREQRDLTEQVLEAAPVGIAVVGSDGEFRLTNDRDDAGSLVKNRATDVVEHDVYDEDGEFVPREDRPWQEVLETGEPVFNWECSVEPSDAGSRWVSVNAVPLASEHGNVDEVVMSTTDVTRLKAQEDWIQRQRDELATELETVFDRVNDGFYALDDDWQFVHLNDRASEVLNREPEELVGEVVWDEFPEAMSSQFEEEYKRAMETQEAVSFEGYFDPMSTWFQVNVYPSETGLSVYFRDVTDRKRREQELERYRTIVETVDDGVYVVDEDGKFTMINDQYVEMTGYSRDELIGTDASTMVDDEIAVRAQTIESDLREGDADSTVVRADLQQKDGETFPAEATFSLLPVENDYHRVGVVRDVTERQRYEETLRGLYDSAEELLSAETKDEVGSAVVDTVADVLDVPGVAVYRHDPDEGELWPAQSSRDSAFMRGELPTVPVGDGSITGTVFADGETTYFEDINESDHLTVEETDMRAGMFVPMASHGVLVVGAREAGAIDGETRQLVELLAANAEESFDRVEWEQNLMDRERQLERYRRIVETVDDGVYVLDDDDRFEMVNETFGQMTGRTREGLLGSHGSVVFGDNFQEIAEEKPLEMQSGDLEIVRFEEEIHRADDETVLVESTFSTFPLSNGSQEGRVGVIRDVTDRKRRERELERYETIVESLWDGVYALDPDGDFVMANEEFLSMTGYSREELLGEPASVVHSEALVEELSEMAHEMVFGDRDTAVIDFQMDVQGGESIPVESRFGPYPYDEGEFGRTGVVRDISDRLERERKLNQRLEQQRVVATLGRRALEVNEMNEMFQEVVEHVAETLDADYCKVLDLDESGESLLLRSGVGWDEGLVGEGTVTADSDSQAGYTLEREEPVHVPDLDDEERFDAPPLLLDHDVSSGISVTIGPEDDPWGVLGVHSEAPRQFDEENLTFLRSVANTVRAAIERLQHEAEIQSRREELAALNRLNELAQDIAHAAVESSTREELEEVVCSNLADADQYQFAWIGELSTSGDELHIRHESGVDGYLKDATLHLSGDHADGPTAQAVRTHETQVCRDALEDSRFEPWRDKAREYGFRSSAAVPVVYEETLYGVLGLYSERVGAFDDYERTVVDRLGDVIGHTVNAIERKRALMADEVVELEFQIQNILESLDVDQGMEGRIVFEQALSVEEDKYVFYGEVDEPGSETLQTLPEKVPHFEEVEVLGEGSGVSKFQTTLADPPVMTKVADRGGRVTRAVMENGDYGMTVQIPRGADVSQFVDAVKSSYSHANVLAQRQTTPPEGPQARTVLTEELTKRQRTTLEASYYAGFFDWPRESTGEDVAEALDISAPTFHQHCRMGQKKVMRAIFEGT